MKTMFAAVAVVAMSVSAVLAPSQSNAQGESTGTSLNLRKNAAQKIKQQLEQAGFSDITFLAKTFVVQAKSQDGDEVLMTFGPHGQAVSKAIDGNNSASEPGTTTGSSSK